MQICYAYMDKAIVSIKFACSKCSKLKKNITPSDNSKLWALIELFPRRQIIIPTYQSLNLKSKLCAIKTSRAPSTKYKWENVLKCSACASMTTLRFLNFDKHTE